MPMFVQPSSFPSPIRFRIAYEAEHADYAKITIRFLCYLLFNPLFIFGP